MKPLLLTLLTASLLFAMEFKGFSNFELENIDFDDTLMISSVFRVRGLPSEWVQGGNPGQVTDADSVEVIPYAYEYDTINNWVTIGAADTFFLDSEQRVTKIQKSDIKTVHITYDTNTKTIISHPNFDTLNNYSQKWEYTYRPDGQIEKILKTPIDWTWEPSGQQLFWNSDKADTMTYTYNAEGQRTSAYYSWWQTDMSHNRWQWKVDSLSYSYSMSGDTTIQEIISHTKIDDSTWGHREGDAQKDVRGDTLWRRKFDAEEKLISQESYRWVALDNDWDYGYFNIVTYTYTADGRVASRKDNLYYGYEAGSVLTEWYEEFTYGPNTLIYGVVSPVSSSLTATPKNDLRFSQQGGQKVVLHGVSDGFDKIMIFDVAGRKIREVSHQNSISLSGISTGQPLLFVATKRGMTVKATKMILR